MNYVQIGDAQLISTWFACLAWLNSPMTIEEKTNLLETNLMCKILSSAQPLTVLISGCPVFDTAMQEYAEALEARTRAIDPTAISTGSPILDVAFSNRIKSLVEMNFGAIAAVVDPIVE